MSEHLHRSTIELEGLLRRLDNEIPDKTEAGPAPASLSMAIVACRLLVTRSGHDGRPSLASWLEQLGRVMTWLQSRHGRLSEDTLPRLKEISVGLEKVLRGLDSGRSLSYLAGETFVAESEACVRDVTARLLPHSDDGASEVVPAPGKAPEREKKAVAPTPKAPFRTPPGAESAPEASPNGAERLDAGLRRVLDCTAEVDLTDLDPVQRARLRRRWLEVRRRCDRLAGAGDERDEKPGSPPAEAPGTVLLVVGSLFRASRLRRRLQKAGRRVVECARAEEALALLESAPTLEAILCDNVEPTANLRRLAAGLAPRQAASRPPLILVTTSESPRMVRRARILGADGCWRAPFALLALDAELAPAAASKATG